MGYMMGAMPGAAVRSRAVARALAVLAVLAAPALSGCADSGRVVDAGPTPGMSLPPVPEKLWKVTPRPSAEPSAEAISEAPEPVERKALPRVTVPAGADAGALDARELIARDPEVEEVFKDAVRTCGKGCGLRPPVLRDVTGDKQRELIAVVDAPNGPANPDEPTPPAAMVYVYRVEGGRVFQITNLSVFPPSQIDLVGTDLVISQQGFPGEGCGDRQLVSRYRWNPEDGFISVVSEGFEPQPGQAPCPKGSTNGNPKGTPS